MMDIGKDLQNAYEEGYKQGEYDAVFGTEMSLPKWIPCSERLPSEKKAVLICDSHGNRFVGKLILTDYGYKWGARLFRVWIDIEDGDAWMPLPKPYGERREE